MTVTFKTASLVKESLHALEYEVEVKYMHGDADAYTTERFYYNSNFEKEMKRLEQTIEGLAFMNGLEEEGRELEREDIAEHFKTLGYSEEDAGNFYDNFTYSDATCEDYLASVDTIRVFFYDADNRKMKVTTRVNGKIL